MDKILKTVKEEDIARYKEIAEELLETYDSISLLSAALKLLTKEPNTTPILLTEEAPLRTRQPRRDRFDQPGYHRKRDRNYPPRFPKR
jgi:ATP-dependent RNA helicase DeaD